MAVSGQLGVAASGQKALASPALLMFDQFSRLDLLNVPAEAWLRQLHHGT